MWLFDFFKKKRNINTSTEYTNDEQKSLFVEQTPILKFSTTQYNPSPLNTLLKTAIPSIQDLYPHEILMLEYAKTFKTSNNTFQQFWYYQYSITDPQSILNSLFEREFIKVEDLKLTLEKQKLIDIKNELKVLKQKVTGRKSELIDRLLKHGDITILNQKYTERYYTLTPKGEQELYENQYVSYLHRKKYMSVWDMNKRIAQKQLHYKNIIWEYFNEQSITHLQNCDFGLYRCTRLDMYDFLMEENKYAVALRMLCEVLLYDLNYLENGDKILFEWKKSDPKRYLRIYEKRLNNLFPYKNTNSRIYPIISDYFAKMQNILNMNDENYKQYLLKEFKDIDIPHRIFTNEECANIVIASINNNTKIISTIYKNAGNREKYRIKEFKTKAH